MEAVGGTDAQLRLAEIPDPCSEKTADADDRSEIGNLFFRALSLVQAEFRDCTWEAFWKTTMDGRNTADVAVELDISENAVRQAKSHVLRRLRAELCDLPVG